MSSVSGSPRTPGAKTDGELRESMTAKAKEADALILQARIMMVTAVDIEA
jgi:hypothetical protein